MIVNFQHIGYNAQYTFQVDMPPERFVNFQRGKKVIVSINGAMAIIKIERRNSLYNNIFYTFGAGGKYASRTTSRSVQVMKKLLKHKVYRMP